jgi:hypothetical protein
MIDKGITGGFLFGSVDAGGQQQRRKERKRNASNDKARGYFHKLSAFNARSCGLAISGGMFRATRKHITRRRNQREVQ